MHEACMLVFMTIKCINVDAYCMYVQTNCMKLYLHFGLYSSRVVVAYRQDLKQSEKLTTTFKTIRFEMSGFLSSQCIPDFSHDG